MQPFEFTITLIIIIITVLVSMGGFSNAKLIDDLIFFPPAVTRRKQWYRFFSYGFIHADPGHLIFNMISLYFFGPTVEKTLIAFFDTNGKWIYLLMYVSALLVSILPSYLKNRENYQYRSLGASGAVSAVLFAGMLIAPTAKIYIFFIPIGIPGFIFAPLYLILSAYLERRGGDSINHSAHIWGALYGLGFLILVGYLAGFDFISYCTEQISGYFQ